MQWITHPYHWLPQNPYKKEEGILNSTVVILNLFQDPALFQTPSVYYFLFSDQNVHQRHGRDHDSAHPG